MCAMQDELFGYGMGNLQVFVQKPTHIIIEPESYSDKHQGIPWEDYQTQAELCSLDFRFG